MNDCPVNVADYLISRRRMGWQFTSLPDEDVCGEDLGGEDRSFPVFSSFYFFNPL